MARVLTCIDPEPAQDGSCATTAWIEQPSWIDYLPTLEQANDVGGAIVLGVIGVMALGLLLPPPEERD